MRDEYFCPNCNAILNDQYGFDPDKGSWTCTQCGTHLMDDDVYEGDTYEGVAWYCDNCGALLNRQSGFYDYCGYWTCTECGYYNSISENEITNNDSSYSNYHSSNYSSSSYSSSNTYSSSPRRTSTHSSKEDNRTIIICLAFFLAMAVLCLGISFLYELKDQQAMEKGYVQVGSSSELIGEDYETVEAHFYAAGFYDIELIDLDDSGLAFWKDGKVKTISVGGKTSFSSSDWFDPDDTVIITYH